MSFNPFGRRGAKFEVWIDYSRGWSFGKRFSELDSQLAKALRPLQGQGVEIKVTGRQLFSSGYFEVYFNGTRVYSMLQNQQFPNINDVVKAAVNECKKLIATARNGWWSKKLSRYGMMRSSVKKPRSTALWCYRDWTQFHLFHVT